MSFFIDNILTIMTGKYHAKKLKKHFNKIDLPFILFT